MMVPTTGRARLQKARVNKGKHNTVTLTSTTYRIRATRNTKQGEEKKNLLPEQQEKVREELKNELF